MWTESGQPLTAVLAVIAEESDLAAGRAVYLQRQAAVAAPHLACFNGVSAFGAALRSNWVDFSAEGAYVVI